MKDELTKRSDDDDLATVVEDLLCTLRDLIEGWEPDPLGEGDFEGLIAKFGERLSKIPLPGWACRGLELSARATCLEAMEKLREISLAWAAALEMEDDIDRCDASDAAACVRLAARAADVAYDTRFPERFGHFPGATRCVIFANMGPTSGQRLAAEVLRQYLEDAGVAELGIGVSSGDGYTWAMLIDSPDAQHWLELTRKALLVAWA